MTWSHKILNQLSYYVHQKFVDEQEVLKNSIVTKSVTLLPREGNPPPRICETPSGMLNSIGLANLGVDLFCKDKLPVLDKINTNVIINIAGSTFNEYYFIYWYILCKFISLLIKWDFSLRNFLITPYFKDSCYILRIISTPLLNKLKWTLGGVS